MIDATQKILLIEDDQLTRQLYERELSGEYQVLACANETEALAFLYDPHQQISAVVLEPVMRSGQGWALLETLRSLFQIRHTPIILCSVLDDRRRGFELGATLCLIKPVLPKTLHASIQQVLNNPVRN